MLVHDIYKKESRAINFQESAPHAVKEIFHNAPELKVGEWETSHILLESFAYSNGRCSLHVISSTQPGQQVGVPSMLKGLHQAHKLYGR